MDNNAFEYTYSAEKQQEIEAIRKKYLPKEEDKMEQLRRLHAIPTHKAQAALGVFALVLGAAVGLAGLVMVALAYPLYNRILRKERQRIAPEILRLTDELLK